MTNGSGLYNLGGGQISPTSQQRQILPIGAATAQRQAMTGREVSGTRPMQGQRQGQGQKQGGLMNILDFMKGILAVPLDLLGGLFGSGVGRGAPQKPTIAGGRSGKPYVG